MNEDTSFKRNILALSATNPLLSSRITQVQSSPEVKFIAARSGNLIPVIGIKNKEYPLHSTFDPVREGNRFLDLYPHNGCLLFLGMGAAYHITPFLALKEVSAILIIDKSIAVLKSILENINLYHLLTDPRLRIIIDGDSEEIKDFILTNYLPSLMGNLTSIPLLPRLNLEKEFFSRTMETLEQVIGTVADDYTVQATFGRKWFTNTLYNLEAAGASTHTLKPQKKIMVTGAGPSLDEQMPALKKMRGDTFLIASDTSLPCLLGNDVIPDLVISIDCQQVSYHHFLCGCPPQVPLLLDLASPPVLTGMAKKIMFFSSGHPFSQYLSRNWRMFPRIDTSGGNVAHAAVSLAERLGAREIYLLGIDFSFPEGKAYARGTYLYNYFRTGETRFQNLETCFFSFIHKNKLVGKEYEKNYIRYIPKPMQNYKERLEAAIRNIAARVIPLGGKGVAITAKNAAKGQIADGNINTLFSAGPKKSDWKDFLRMYLTGIDLLPAPSNPLFAYFSRLDSREKDLWTTQLPLASDFRKHGASQEHDSAGLLEQVRAWTREKVLKLIND